MRLRTLFQGEKLQSSQRVINTKCAFKIKHKEDISIEKYEALFAAKDFKQKNGIGYTETYSPAVEYGTLRMVIEITKYFGYSLDQINMVTDFLYWVIKEKAYCDDPEDAELNKEFVCLELAKAINGLKQALIVWTRLLMSFCAASASNFQTLTHFSK